MDWQTFIKHPETKHSADIAIGDVVLVDDGKHFDYEDKKFVRGVIDSYIGNDFSGYLEDTGKGFGIRKNVDLYKIIGSQISIHS